jgi:L-alanine-DL-glutamate epimerase-like enolase superfamily enzyme
MPSPITDVAARAYRIPTDGPESDGTFAWDSTTLVLARVRAEDGEGTGYSYAGRGAVAVIEDSLKPAIAGLDADDIPAAWLRMCRAVRNIGRSGEAACAISAVDCALWDLKAKLLRIPLIRLLGSLRDSVAVYGSGGFTNHDARRVAKQIEEWRGQGIGLFKIKIGRDWEEDKRRIEAAVKAMPEGGRLFVDANGAYHPKEALEHAREMGRWDIGWFEEPVTMDDIRGLRLLREHAPACMEIAAGEYIYNPDDARRLLEADAVDVLQLDATRCLGLTGFMKAAALAEVFHRPVSSHCAPALHAAAMCHAPRAEHIEYFRDHARIERMLFDGAPEVKDGRLVPQAERPGSGWTFKEKDAERFAL